MIPFTQKTVNIKQCSITNNFSNTIPNLEADNNKKTLYFHEYGKVHSNRVAHTNIIIFLALYKKHTKKITFHDLETMLPMLTMCDIA